MGRLSVEDMALIDNLFKTGYCDIIEEVQKIKSEHPEEWAEYEKRCREFWDKAVQSARNDPSFLSRRYYGKRKVREDHHGEETENAGN